MGKLSMRTAALIGASIGIVGIFTLQVATADTTTKTESALFSVLQFILSIAFAWILSTKSNEKNFQDSQKKFAIAAFRRIKEIERALSRAQQLVVTDSEGKASPRVGHHGLIVSLLSAQDAVNSSIADWGDVIGSEIQVAAEIEKLKSLRKTADKFERDYIDNLRREVAPASPELAPKIQALQESLPGSLKITESQDADHPELKAIIQLQNLMANEVIKLYGFWTEDDSFSSTPEDLNPGDIVYIARGYTEHRSDVVLAYKPDKSWFGVITNPFAELELDYDSFTNLFEHMLSLDLRPPQFGGQMIPCTVIAVGEKNEGNECETRSFDLALPITNQMRKRLSSDGGMN
nr:hypothetical protein [uncultured Pseudomonas sp.]